MSGNLAAPGALGAASSESREDSIRFNAHLGRVALASLNNVIALGTSAPANWRPFTPVRRIVVRTFQRTRWIDGRTVVWLGRHALTGRGEGSSGLEFDVLEELASRA